MVATRNENDKIANARSINALCASYCLWLIISDHKSKCVKCCRYFVIQNTDSSHADFSIFSMHTTSTHTLFTGKELRTNFIFIFYAASVRRLQYENLLVCSHTPHAFCLFLTHTISMCWLHNPLDWCVFLLTLISFRLFAHSPFVRWAVVWELVE